MSAKIGERRLCGYCGRSVRVDDEGRLADHVVRSYVPLGERVRWCDGSRSGGLA